MNQSVNDIKTDQWAHAEHDFLESRSANYLKDGGVSRAKLLKERAEGGKGEPIGGGLGATHDKAGMQ